MDEYEVLTIEEVVERIITLTEGLTRFWSSANGWAPVQSSDLLTKSRLDWQFSLSKQLRYFTQNENEENDGKLILGWALLGSLVEGTIKLFLSVWYKEYESDALTKLKGYTDKHGDLIEPDILMLEKLKQFLCLQVYPTDIRKIWRAQNKLDLIDYIDRIQANRNSIHAFKHKEIGEFKDLFDEIRNYRIFLNRMTDGFPYPENMYVPTEI